MTGTLMIVTYGPTDRPAVRTRRGGCGRFNQTRFKGAVSRPLGNGIAGLVLGYFSNRDGWFDNLGAAPRCGDRRTYSGRVALATTGSDPAQARM